MLTRRVEVRPVDPTRLADLARLFATNGTTAGCYCMYFLVTSREYSQGWGAANKAHFEEFARAAVPPAGLLAYRDGEPVGWCALGPRSRYGRVLRSPLTRGRDHTEDDTTWMVPCFFVRRDSRGSGLMVDLLNGAVRLAGEYGAPAVEGVPLVGGRRHPTSEGYLGTESAFTAAGFRVVARPSARRLVMRRDFA
jgi:GNAT superfamily N-acetyltransferase